MTRPDEMDLAARRQRRVDTRPEPPEELREWESAADRRLGKRPYPPNIILAPDGAGGEHWTSPHADESLWVLQLCEAFGTRSQAIITTFMRQLQALASDKIWDKEAGEWLVDEVQLSAMLAIINSVKPRNEMEACLAAQMVAVHLMQMKLSAQVLQSPYDTRTAAVAGKLARTFTGQIEAMQGLKGKRRAVKQTIVVKKETHQHVHYHHDRGAGENGRQPQTTVGSSTAPRTPLPSEEESGRVVRLAGRARQAGV
jgi:hypothetical protein